MSVWNWLLILSGAALILIEVAAGGFAGFDLVLIGSAFVDLKGASPVQSNADALLGRKGLVLARIASHHPGRVRVNQEEWRAVLAPDLAEPLEAGAEITVTGMDGVTLQVR